MNTPKKKTSLLTLAFTLILIVFLYPKMQNPHALQALIIQLGWKGILLDLVIISGQMIFPFIPFALLAGMNTLLFGWKLGFALSLIGSLLGSMLSFGLSRTLGQEWARPKLAKLGKWAKLSEGKNFYLIVLARLIPILPAAAVNYAAGLSPMKFTSFFWATLIGKIPMIAWESWVGHDFWNILNHPWRFVFALLIGALIIGCAWYGWKLLDQRETPKA